MNLNSIDYSGDEQRYQARKRAESRVESDRNRAAELNAQTEMLDRDRIILAALSSLEYEARSRGYRYPACYIAGAAGIETRHTSDSGDAYVLRLLAEIRAQLSPLVKP